MSTSRRISSSAIAALLLAAMPVHDLWAADADEIAELRRAIDALRSENRALAQRLATLEGTKPAPAAPEWGQRIEQRVKELEFGKVAQEDAVRSIIRDSVSTLGSKINESVSLSGAIDFTARRTKDYAGVSQSAIGLSAVEFEFDVQVNPWATASILLEYVDGRDLSFQTSNGGQAGVDRLSVETAFVSFGDPQRFPLQLKAGKMVLPFGISTGRLLADVLSSSSPLTVELFEMRQSAIGLSVAFPTPALRPPTPPVVVPPVRPLVIEPMLHSLGQRLGYAPPPVRVSALAPTAFAPEAPPFNAGVYIFDARTPGGVGRHAGATVGYQMKGNCGRSYDQLAGSGLCPWTLSVDLNYNSSIFSSRFLETEYEGFLERIGRVPAMAASFKASFGAMSLIGEWNSATRRARFVDDTGAPVGIRPAAWQLSLGYQFDWNPWVQEIGAQGTFAAIGYSQSRDLAGVTQLLGGVPTRVGFAPRSRLLLTVGEWVVDGVRVVVEYSRESDYAVSAGGTGKLATSLTTKLTYSW